MTRGDATSPERHDRSSHVVPSALKKNALARGAGNANSSSLLDVIDALDEAGIGIDLSRSARRPVVVFDPPLADASVLSDETHGWLTRIVMGRYTGHAPATCDHCGAITMLSIVAGNGTRRGLKSTGWPRCPVCGEGRRIIRDRDFEGVRRVRPPSIPRADDWLAKQRGTAPTMTNTEDLATLTPVEPDVPPEPDDPDRPTPEQ